MNSQSKLYSCYTSEDHLAEDLVEQARELEEEARRLRDEATRLLMIKNAKQRIRTVS